MTRAHKTTPGGGTEDQHPAHAGERGPRDSGLHPLRAVTTQGVTVKSEKDGSEQSAIVLQDPEGYAPKPIIVTTEALAAALLFDGQRSAEDVARLFETRYGAATDPDEIRQLAAALDRGLFLASPRFEAKLRKTILDYLEVPVRPAANAGSAYPSEPDELRRMVEGFFTAPGGPGALPPCEKPARHCTPGLVLPHIDLRVGGATYAHGYKALLEGSQADLFVILGVAHQAPGEGLFYVSTKDFATPLGTVKTWRAAAARLQGVADVDAPVAEYTHRGEHSVEFQAMLLQALLADRGRREFEVLPVLCGSIEPFIERLKNPLGDIRFQRFVETLRRDLDASGRRWTVLASVDFSHVGPKFNDFTPLDEKHLPAVRRGDERLFAPIEQLDAEGFLAEVYRTRNSRHVDAVMPVVTLLQLGKNLFRRVRRLRYDQMLEAATKSVVSFVAMAFESDGE